MNKVITSLLLILLAGITGSNAQNLITIDGPEYQQLKSEGKIPMIPMEQFAKYVPEKILNAEDFAPRATAGGGPNVNCGCIQTLDGSYTLAMGPNDDGSTGLISLPFTFCLYGTSQNSMYINNNGNISFGTSYGTFSSNPFPDPGFVMVAPFWADVDTRGTGQVWYKVTPTYAIIRWNNVGYYSSQTDKINDFQLIITNGTDPIIPNGNNVAFCYGDMQWTTGSASNGVGGFGGTPATVGANLGDGTSFVQFGRFDHAGVDYDGPFGNADGISWLDNQSFVFNACVNNSNIAPIADNALAICDTIQICIGDTVNFDVSFLSPEQDQTTITTIDTSGVSGFQLISNTSGNISSVSAVFYATEDNVGYNTFTLSASDNGTPAQTNDFVVNIFVSEIVDPSLIGEFTYCAPGSVSITLDSAFAYESWTWSTGDANPDSVLDPLLEGNYSVTCYNEYGCNRTLDFQVVELGNLQITNTVTDILCNGAANGSVVSQSNVPTQLSFFWSDSQGDTIHVGLLTQGTDQVNGLEPGTYYVSIYDTLGCFSYLDSVVVTEPLPYVTDNTSSPETCEQANGVAVVTSVSGNTAPYSYLWSPAGGTDATATDLSTGTYTVTITDANGCVEVDTVIVPGIASPTANFSSDPLAALLDVPVTFTDSSLANGDSIVAWFWDFGDGSTDSVPNPVHAYGDTGTYPVMLVVTNTEGCTDTIYNDIIVITEIVVPNVFTPNGDGFNDTFVIQYLPQLYPNSKLYIYNRWGKRVYKSDNYQNDWDGEKHSEGTYFYVLYVSDGTEKTGTVTMMK
ncbi:MAG: gliding motility-associated C-terminal domain-containing protein [Bacteroidia bacterium]